MNSLVAILSLSLVFVLFGLLRKGRCDNCEGGCGGCIFRESKR
jgi:hypothetical protein